MQPDLKIAHLDELIFETHCVISKEISDIIKRLSPPRNNVCRFYDRYVKSRTTHHSILYIKFEDEESGNAEISFRYILAPRLRPLPKNVPRLSQIINELCIDNTEHQFKCIASFEYTKRDKKRLVINLPLEISSSPGMAIKKIDGISFTGNIQGLEYSAFMLIGPNKYGLSVHLDKNYIISNTLPENIISDASIISSVLVI